MTETSALPFRLRGETGRVPVAYGVNTDPSFWGFGLVDVPFDLSLVRGFPIVHATTELPVSGYFGLMGWIQVVTVDERSSVNSWSSVDVYLIHWQTDTPFSTFGHLPHNIMRHLAYSASQTV